MGVEEELLLVDAATGEPLSVAEAVLQRGREIADTELEKELKQEQIETGTAPHKDLSELHADVVHWRRRADEAAKAAGARVAALATSPLAVTPRTTRNERYELMGERFGLTHAQQLVCGCHVHVGIGSAEEGVGVIDRVRTWLPVLTALSVNSPFWQGEDTGYASFRSQMWDRWPMAGAVEVLGSVDAYERLVEDMLATDVVADQAMVYLDTRLSAKYPTVELRVTDVCLRADDAALLAGLARALVQTAADQWSAGEPALAVPAYLVNLARWRAGRSGLSGTLLDPVTMRPRPATDVVEQLFAHVRTALVATGDETDVRRLLEQLLARGTGATRQRETHERTGALAEVVKDAVSLTV
jgi:carboxylate-amine ligase